MPTYDNQIIWGTGFKFGQGVPVDDRYVFDDVAQANSYITTDSFFIYEGLWSYIITEEDYFIARRTDTGLPWESTTNPYIWIKYSTLVGGLPSLGLPDQQLIVNEAGSATEFSYFNQRGLFRFVGAVSANPSINEGTYVRQTSSTTFEDVYTASNFPINSRSKLPLYFVFKIDGDDLIVGKFGIYQAVSHQLPQREQLYLKTTYSSGAATYYLDLLTTAPSAVEGEYNLVVGNAIDSNNIFVDLTRDAALVPLASGGGSANAYIFRTKAQRYGVGGIPADPALGDEVIFTVPHAFGKSTGIVQVVNLNLTGDIPGSQISVNDIFFEENQVRVDVDYGLIDDTSILEVILIF